MILFRFALSLCAMALFLMMVLGQFLCVFHEGTQPTFAQERTPSVQTKNVRRCREIELLARTQYGRLNEGQKQMLQIVESAQKRIDEIHASETIDYESSGRMHFIMLLATIQSNKQSQYADSALDLAADAATALAVHDKAKQDVPDAIVRLLDETSASLDSRIRAVGGLIAEMKESVAHPERPFSQPKK